MQVHCLAIESLRARFDAALNRGKAAAATGAGLCRPGEICCSMACIQRIKSIKSRYCRVSKEREHLNAYPLIMDHSMKHMDLISGTFILGFLSMGFQLVASRLLAPYFGSSIIVWAFLISTFLAAFSCGSFLGGWISKKSLPARKTFLRRVLVAAVSGFAVTAFGGRYLLSIVDASVHSMSVGLSISCMLLFFVPIMMVSSFIPVITDILARRGMSTGAASGLVYGISTIGNISGVMGTTFVLIPNFTVSSILGAWVLISTMCLACMEHRIEKEDT